jgi:hypothetical protein
MCCGSGTHLVCPVILVRAPRVPVPTGTHGESPALADRISLTVHRNTSLLTPRDSPLLCKTGVSVASRRRDHPTSPRRHQEMAQTPLDLVDPMQRPTACGETGNRRSSPPNHRPCQIRARYSGDQRSTVGSHGDTDRHAPTKTSTVIAGQAPLLQRGGSRIRTLEGISPRIYSPLPFGRSSSSMGILACTARRRPCP